MGRNSLLSPTWITSTIRRCISVRVLLEIQRNKCREATCSSVGDVALQDLQTDAAEHRSDSELRHPPPTAESQVQRNWETGTGNRCRRHAAGSSSSCGCWSEQLERRLSRTLSRVCETLDRGERRQQREDCRTSNRVAWQHVSIVVDRLLLMVFTVGTVIITLGVLLHAPLSRYFIFGPPDNDGAISTKGPDR